MFFNGKNKERMKKTEVTKILEWHNSGTLKTDEAVERICSLFNVVGQSEQLHSCKYVKRIGESCTLNNNCKYPNCE